MSTAELKIQMHQLIDQFDDEDQMERGLEMLKELLGFKKPEKEDWWEDLTPEQQQSIDQRSKEIDNGNYLTEEEFFQEVEGWRTKNFK